MITPTPLTHSELGKKSTYTSKYSPDLLFPVARKTHREEIGISEPLAFFGYDIWNAYEISWLNKKGKPMVAIGTFIAPCTSPNIFESKSLKLYLNSFNSTHFETMEQVEKIIKNDLSHIAGEPVDVHLFALSHRNELNLNGFSGVCLDSLDISTNEYTVNPALLKTENNNISESLYSDLLKSNCPMTGQPDWASIQVIYTGPKMNHESLLKYLISYRNNNEFHEHCVERIFTDILHHCKPSKLVVDAHFTRRGGIDINPIRSTEPKQTVQHLVRRLGQ